jgi:hypothetical protein
MNIQYKNVAVTFIVALVLVIPVGMIIKGDTIKKSETPHPLFSETASALSVPKTEAKPAETPKVDTPVVAPKPVAPTPTPEPAPVVLAGIDGNCESWRPLVQKYFGDATDGALIVMQHESSCIHDRVSETNDYGLMQLNGMMIFDPEANIAAGYQKFVHPRRGTTPNFSAWYAVCTPNLVPKYAGIWCN